MTKKTKQIIAGCWMGFITLACLVLGYVVAGGLIPFLQTLGVILLVFLGITALFLFVYSVCWAIEQFWDPPRGSGGLVGEGERPPNEGTS